MVFFKKCVSQSARLDREAILIHIWRGYQPYNSKYHFLILVLVWCISSSSGLIQNTLLVLNIWLIHIAFAAKLQSIKLQILKLQPFSILRRLWQLNHSEILKIKPRSYKFSILKKSILGDIIFLNKYSQLDILYKPSNLNH